MTENITRHLSLKPENNDRLLFLCGPYNTNLKFIADHLHVELKNRGHQFTVTGEQSAVDTTISIIQQLYEETQTEKALSKQQLHLAVRQHTMPDQHKHTAKAHHLEHHIKARSKHQQQYIDNIHHNSINIGIGPAGTGKTFLAVACAVDALKKDRIRRIVLVRPAVEAGEKLGFLPGDMAQKVDPYLRPLYDALYELLGMDYVNRLLSKNIIEIAPLAYMRGRTLNDAFIILDESQNTTPEQMKMFLTRIGFGSTVVVNGDITQIDLPPRIRSGLLDAIDILKGVKGISFTFFDANDVVRHPIVQSVINAYDKHKSENRADKTHG
ncbi:MAG: PhoH family protein [Pseudomonadota bacterium]